MAINKKLIHFNKLADFESRLAANEILDTSIVFIKDAKKIYTHGNYYDCDPSDLERSIEEINNTIGNNTTNRTIVERIEAVENQTIPDARSKVLWLGTSIPAGDVSIDPEQKNTYPYMVADALGLGGTTDEEKLENLITALDGLKEKVGIKKTIKDYGIDEKDFLDRLDDMVEQAFDDQCTGANPRLITERSW